MVDGGCLRSRIGHLLWKPLRKLKNHHKAQIPSAWKGKLKVFSKPKCSQQSKRRKPSIRLCPPVWLIFSQGGCFNPDVRRTTSGVESTQFYTPWHLWRVGLLGTHHTYPHPKGIWNAKSFTVHWWISRPWNVLPLWILDSLVKDLVLDPLSESYTSVAEARYHQAHWSVTGLEDWSMMWLSNFCQRVLVWTKTSQ